MKNENAVRIALFLVGFVTGFAGERFGFGLLAIILILSFVSVICIGYGGYIIAKSGRIPRHTKDPHDSSETVLFE